MKLYGRKTLDSAVMSGRKERLQKQVRNKAPYIIWTHCILHRQAFASRNVIDELKTVF
jgi:hypothetical protein